MQRTAGRLILLATAVLSPLAPTRLAHAQQEFAQRGDFAVGVRAGTLGLGADATFALNDQFALRGGAGFLGFDVGLTGRFGLADNRTAELDLPGALYTVGAEASVGAVRLGAGLLIKSGAPIYTVTYGDGALIEIGGNHYTQPEILTIATTVDSKSTALYALLGFGSQRSRGLSFAADLGVAFLQDVDLAMDPTGDPEVLASAAFRTDLEAERRETKDDAGGLLNFWPIVSIGMRYGF